MILEELPESVQYLAGVIGLTEALALLSLRGGNVLAVPKNYHEDNWLNEAIGESSAKKLIAHYGGETVELPTSIGAFRVVRNINIYNDHLAGLSNADLSSKYGMTTRNIRKILALRLNQRTQGNAWT